MWLLCQVGLSARFERNRLGLWECIGLDPYAGPYVTLYNLVKLALLKYCGIFDVGWCRFGWCGSIIG